MDDLIERLRALSRHEHSDYSIGDEAADALEAAQSGLRYAVKVWVLADEIEWGQEDIDDAVKRVIGYAARKEARNG